VGNVVYAGPEAIERRLEELDREWTIGRIVKVSCGVAIFVGFGLAMFVNPWWFALPAVVGLLLLQYGVSRWSVLTWVLHAAGFRTGRDVEHERIALKALRGDFRHLPTIYDKDDEDAVARLEGEGGIPSGPAVTPKDGHVAANEVLDKLQH
jgi:hypothetical protein